MDNPELEILGTVKGIDSIIFSLAEKFHFAADSLDGHYLEPKVVNLSFAIELYIKCLQTETTYFRNNEPDDCIVNRKVKTIRVKKHGGHDLYALFQKLDPELQNDLSILYYKRFSSNLIDTFSENNSAFVDFRYSYEKEELIVSTTELENCASFLRSFITAFLRLRK